MAAVNWKRILGGGVVAGLLMNISEALLHGAALGAEGAALFRSLNIPATAETWQTAALVGMTFLLGLAAVWLYAAIRPRYGPGPATALRSGLLIWLVAHLWSGVYLGAGFTGVITPKLAWLPVAWGFFEAPLATLAGAWLYRE